METILFSLFALLMAIEIVISLFIKKALYTWKGCLENLGIAIFSFGCDYGFSWLSYPLFTYVYEQYRLLDIPTSMAYYIFLFVLLDFLEYIFHYISHKRPLLWAAHKVHHQSKEFNLSVGLRTSFLIPLFNLGFYFLPVLIGFRPQDLMLILLLQGFYQLLQHTQFLKKTWLDKVLVTPPVHRVHHGINALYIDRNFGKVLLLWDHLFGTYQAETEQVEYGATHAEGEEGIIRALFVPLVKWQHRKRRE